MANNNNSNNTKQTPSLTKEELLAVEFQTSIDYTNQKIYDTLRIPVRSWEDSHILEIASDPERLKDAIKNFKIEQEKLKKEGCAIESNEYAHGDPTAIFLTVKICDKTKKR